MQIIRGNDAFEALLGDAPSRVIHALPDAEYHALGAYSASGAKLLLRSPAHFKAAQEEPHEPTPAMVLGTAVHMAILEPERFASFVAVTEKPDEGREKAAAKRERLEQEARMREQGFLILTKEQRDTAARIADIAREHPGIRAAFGDRASAEIAREVTVLWRDPQFGIPCKSRFDVLRADGVVVDLKTTTDASAEAFGRAAASYRYDLQAAVYNVAHECALHSSLRSFIFCAIETSPPHGLALYHTESNVFVAAMPDVARSMLAYMESRITDSWPNYPPQITPLKFPSWALKRANV